MNLWSNHFKQIMNNAKLLWSSLVVWEATPWNTSLQVLLSAVSRTLKFEMQNELERSKNLEKNGAIKASSNSMLLKNYKFVLQASNALKPDWQRNATQCFPFHVDISAKKHSCFVHGPLQSAATLAFATLPVGVVPTKGIDFSDAFHLFSHSICIIYMLFCSSIYHHVVI